MRDEADEVIAIEDELRGAALLADFAVDARFEGEVGGVEVGDDPGTERRERVEAFAARELNVAPLEIARGHVVGAGIAEHVTRGPPLAKRCGGLANHYREFALVMEVAGLRRINDFVAGTDHRG